MSPAKTVKTVKKVEKPDVQIDDKDILKKCDHLFTEETKKAVADTTATIKWPRYVRIQRQRRILMKRMKVPPPVNQFNHTLDKASAVQLFKFLEHYKPESKAEKRDRIRKTAEKAEKSLAAEKTAASTGLVHGIKNVTSLIENKKARLVVIAHDVDPIELVVWLPALCRKQDIPYCIVKSKSRLGKIVGMSTTSVVAIADVKAEDRDQLGKLVDAVNSRFMLHFKEEMHQWGGGELSEETIARLKAQGKHE